MINHNADKTVPYLADMTVIASVCSIAAVICFINFYSRYLNGNRRWFITIQYFIKKPLGPDTVSYPMVFHQQ